VHELLAPTGILAHLPAHNVATLTGKQFFPQLITGPFHHGLEIVFSMAIALLVIAAGVSLLRGKRYVHDEQGTGADVAAETAIGASPELAVEVAAEEEIIAESARPADQAT
jgi:hypothetical protein